MNFDKFDLLFNIEPIFFSKQFNKLITNKVWIVNKDGGLACQLLKILKQHFKGRTLKPNIWGKNLLWFLVESYKNYLQMKNIRKELL